MTTIWQALLRRDDGTGRIADISTNEDYPPLELSPQWPPEEAARQGT